MSLPVPATRVEQAIARIAQGLLAWRRTVAVLAILVTALLATAAMRTHLDAGFNKLIPLRHSYMQAFLQHAAQFSGANRVMVSVRWKGEGDIYNAQFLDTLRQITDEVFFIPGVNRGQVFSLYTPNVRYVEVTENGFVGEVLIPSRFNADAEGLAQVRSNVSKSGQIGRLVSKDQHAAMVRADLLETNPATGARLDYADVARKLEEIRTRHQSENIEIHIVGFTKVLGDVMEGLFNVILFFGVAFVITAVLLLVYSRSLSLTLLALLVALLPVVWLLGLLPLLGYGIDPMSILVPFLIFSIGVSHAVQMTNAWKYEMRTGSTAIHAAELAFRRLAIPGTLALLMNALGFMVIMLIDIPIVHELGLTACLGVSLMIFTNKVILPVALSYLPYKRSAEEKNPDGMDARSRARWWAVSALAEPKPALVTFAISLVLLAGGHRHVAPLAHG